MAFIYTLKDPITEKIRYIGKTCNTLEKRLSEHVYESKRSNRKSCNWIKSLLKKDKIPIIEILEECDCLTANITESYWIYQFISWGFNLTNHTMGGEGGYRYETENQKEIRKERFKGEKNPFFGKKHSEESKKKISQAGKGRKMPISHIISCKKRMIDFKPTEKAIKNMINRTKKSVVQLNLDNSLVKIWDIINECERNTNFSASGIIGCCKKRAKTHKNFKWMYLEEYNERIR